MLELFERTTGMIEVDSELPGLLREELGESLRVVATHHERAYDFVYLRNDVEAKYSQGEFQKIFEDLVLEGMERNHFEQLFHIGALEGGAWGFEEAAVVYFPGEGYSGLVVSIDRNGPINIDRLIKLCRANIENGLAS
jgi:hypothetical protein